MDFSAGLLEYECIIKLDRKKGSQFIDGTPFFYEFI
jgi:hypothetical protein